MPGPLALMAIGGGLNLLGSFAGGVSARRFDQRQRGLAEETTQAFAPTMTGIQDLLQQLRRRNPNGQAQRAVQMAAVVDPGRNRQLASVGGAGAMASRIAASYDDRDKGRAAQMTMGAMDQFQSQKDNSIRDALSMLAGVTTSQQQLRSSILSAGSEARYQSGQNFANNLSGMGGMIAGQGASQAGRAAPASNIGAYQQAISQHQGNVAAFDPVGITRRNLSGASNPTGGRMPFRPPTSLYPIGG